MAKEQLISFPNLERVLREYGEEVVKHYKDSLTEGNHNASEELLNSVRYIASFGDRTYEISLNLAEQWKWLEYGTVPHFPPIDSILKWIQIKPVIPRQDKNGKLPTEKQLAFLIARGISETGTTAYGVLQKTIEEINHEYLEKIYDAIDEDLDGIALFIFNDFMDKPNR